ncbi:hypothetical protein AGMMS49940_10360 [Spirochaetia bacterium]|nr:hypothetical protein AGMMS49940_10360 [Spirochaetia bacterium]
MTAPEGTQYVGPALKMRDTGEGKYDKPSPRLTTARYNAPEGYFREVTDQPRT